MNRDTPPRCRQCGRLESEQLRADRERMREQLRRDADAICVKLKFLRTGDA